MPFFFINTKNKLDYWVQKGRWIDDFGAVCVEFKKNSGREYNTDTT